MDSETRFSQEVLPTLRRCVSTDAACVEIGHGFQTPSSQMPDACRLPIEVLGSPVPSTTEELDFLDKGAPPQGPQDPSNVPSKPFMVSISMPPRLQDGKHMMVNGDAHTNGSTDQQAEFLAGHPQQPKLIFYSQPIHVGSMQRSASLQQKDKPFDSFKTWSGRLERQISNLRGRPQEPSPSAGFVYANEIENLPVDRYFDALEGPELETLKASEVPVLPQNQRWPFLLRFPISSYGICLGLGSQAILWKTLATASSTSFLHVTLRPNLILWCTALALLVLVSSIYLLKIIFYFEAVKREYYHPVRINFFFAPWIACLFLALGVPPSITVNLHAPIWYVMMAPIFCLELKIYGQWMSGGQRRLSKVANPSNHLSIVGNFVGALLGANMGLKEGPIFFFAIGLAHYIVLFVTLYQRLPTNQTLPKELHPVFFLFVAAPSVACVAWARIRGDFDYGSRFAYFIALFLYVSLAVRINFFRGFRFSLAWWAYTFPMTGASIATIQYSMEKRHLVTRSLAIALTGISTFMVSALLVSTVLHAFVLRDLFPNDISIAISEKRSRKKHTHNKLSGCEEDSVSPDNGRTQYSV